MQNSTTKNSASVTRSFNGGFILKLKSLKVPARHLEALKAQVPGIEVGAIQLMLSLRGQLYMMHTLKESFHDLNQHHSSLYKTRPSMGKLISDLMSENQRSNYQSENSFSYAKSYLQVEEEDLFRFNCEDIQPNDKIYIQVVTTNTDEKISLDKTSVE